MDHDLYIKREEDDDDCYFENGESYAQSQCWYEENPAQRASLDRIREGFGISSKEWRAMKNDEGESMKQRAVQIKGTAHYGAGPDRKSIKYCHVTRFCEEFPQFGNAPPAWKQGAILRLLSLRTTEYIHAIGDQDLGTGVPLSAGIFVSGAQETIIRGMCLNVTLISDLDTPKRDQTVAVIHIRDILRHSKPICVDMKNVKSKLSLIGDPRMSERKEESFFLHPWPASKIPIKDTRAFHAALLHMVQKGITTGGLLRLHDLPSRHGGQVLSTTHDGEVRRNKRKVSFDMSAEDSMHVKRQSTEEAHQRAVKLEHDQGTDIFATARYEGAVADYREKLRRGTITYQDHLNYQDLISKEKQRKKDLGLE